jgi:CubicO group peptidase (beta-lactamase class C family)
MPAGPLKNRFVLFLFLFCVAFVGGQGRCRARPTSVDSAALDAFIEGQLRAQPIPGVAVTVVEEGEVVHAQGYGRAAPGRAMTAQTPLYIGSLTKSFTALAVMQRVEDGEVALDAPVQTYLPWFTTTDAEAAARITVRHLLNHTSGLTRTSAGWDAVPPETSMEAAARQLATAELASPPGTAYHYANENYMLLGLIIEAVSGQSYERYMQAHVFAPLEMTATFASPAAVQEAGVAQGYNAVLGLPVARPQPFSVHGLPAGHLVTTAEDMGRYLQFQLGAPVAETPVLSPEHLRRMHTPPDQLPGTDYGMGWSRNERSGVATIEHSGDLETFHSVAVLLPEQDRAFALLFNLNGIPESFTYNAITDRMVALLSGQEVQNVLSLRWIYGGLALIVVLDVARKVRALRRLPTWREKVEQRPRWRAIAGAALNLAIPLLIIVGGPLLLALQLGAAVTRVLILYYVVDVALWLLITSLLTFALGVRKLQYLLS